MKSRLVILTLSVVAVLAVASLALAQPYGRGPGSWVNQIPQDKQEQVAALYAEGRQKLYELESRKWARQAELNALLASPKPEASKIEALAKEIGNLSSMVYQERVALQQRIAKETGVTLPLAGGGGPGYGPGGCPMASGGPSGCPMVSGASGQRGGWAPQAGNAPSCCPQ